jgi:ATP-dependent DNA ligase
MKDYQWLKPELVREFEFLERTPEIHLRHTRFVGLREDKVATEVPRGSVARTSSTAQKLRKEKPILAFLAVLWHCRISKLRI